MRRRAGQPIEHLQRSGEIELREVGKDHEADVEGRHEGSPRDRFGYICPGNQSASCGKAVSRNSSTNMMMWNGMVPITTSLSSPSQMLWMTNKLMPIGGEI